MEVEQELENVKTPKTKLGIVHFFPLICVLSWFLIKDFIVVQNIKTL